jgi:hypothetical protein
MEPTIRRARLDQNCRGSALLVAAAAAIPLLIAGGTMLVTLVSQRTAAEQAAAGRAAQDVSASGAHDAIAQIEADPTFSGTYVLALNGHEAEVTVVDWAVDGADNDGNGLVDDPAEAGFRSITSVGRVNVELDANGNVVERAARSATSTTTAIVQRQDLDLAVNQAYYCHDPEADWDFIGTEFLISGNDTNPDGTPGTAVSVAGIGTPGSTVSISAQIHGAQKNLVVGKGPQKPNVRKVSGIDVDHLMTDWIPYAQFTLEGPSDHYDGTLGERASLQPIVAHAKGDLVLEGTVTGCGVLIVEGDLEVTGELDYAGLVIVGGNLSFRANGLAQRLYGAVVTISTVVGEDVEVGGDAELYYSAALLADVADDLSPFTLVSWTQR